MKGYALTLAPQLVVVLTSYQCQKEAWKDPIFPHKKLCSQIHAVRQQLGPAAWASLWSNDTQTNEFLALPAAEAMDRKAVLEIGSTLAAMRNFLQ